jgi:hypothetical protein
LPEKLYRSVTTARLQGCDTKTALPDMVRLQFIALIATAESARCGKKALAGRQAQDKSLH